VVFFIFQKPAVSNVIFVTILIIIMFTFSDLSLMKARAISGGGGGIASSAEEAHR